MDEDRARGLLRAERAEAQSLLRDRVAASEQNQETKQETGDSGDVAQTTTAEEVDDAVATGLRERLAAVDRAEQRLAEGTYGRSIRSDQPIPDARLVAEPTAELTVEEAEQER